jgi:enoyl-CoA hydratase/carnithine racemase
MSVLRYEKKGRIAYLTLNRPDKRNALSYELLGELEKAWIDFRDDDGLWVAVLTGAGRTFCAGLDLRERAAQGSFIRAGENRNALCPGLLKVWKPIIAAVNGPAYAGGWLLAMECDLRIASEDARFAITEVQIGAPAIGSAHLPRYIPTAIAMEMLFTGDPLSAQRAYEVGFVNKVVPADELMPAATALAERLCRNAPLAIRLTKEAAFRYIYPSDEEAAASDTIMSAALTSEDLMEGAIAYAQNRPPVWKGR